jgi:hypothetical protein
VLGPRVATGPAETASTSRTRRPAGANGGSGRSALLARTPIEQVDHAQEAAKEDRALERNSHDRLSFGVLRADPVGENARSTLTSWPFSAPNVTTSTSSAS